jgi:hypothetical protein
VWGCILCYFIKFVAGLYKGNCNNGNILLKAEQIPSVKVRSKMSEKDENLSQARVGYDLT